MKKITFFIFALFLIQSTAFSRTVVASVNTQVHSDALRADLSSVASSISSKAVNFKSDALDSTATTVADKLAERVSVKDFGAIGNYNPLTGTGTDDSVAFLKAFKYAMGTYGAPKAIHVPTGKYLITTNNFLGLAANFAVNGMQEYFAMIGEGFGSQIYFKPSGGVADYWMYDNTTGGNSLITPQFENLFFKWESDNVAVGSTINGFKENGVAAAATQSFTFRHVKFVGELYQHPENLVKIAKMGTVLKAIGSVNADKTTMINCEFMGVKTVLEIDGNAESVVHEIVNGHGGTIYGDVFKVSAGSNINVYGGAWGMFSQARSYFLNITTKTAGIFGTFNFHDIRVEQNYADPKVISTHNSRILNIDATSLAGAAYPMSVQPVINFDACNFYPNAETDASSIRVDAATSAIVNFSGCAFNNTRTQGISAFSSIASIQNVFAGPFTAINFINGHAVQAENITYASADAVVRVSSRNCTNTLDYDVSVNLATGGTKGRNVPLKTAVVWGKQWRDIGAGANYMAVKLPANVLLKAIRFRKVAGGASATSYQLMATDAGFVTNYGSSTVAPQNLKHEMTVDNLNIVTDTATKQWVYVITTAENEGSATATPMGVGDYFLVDYY